MTTISTACYITCNAAILTIEKTGKAPALCAPGSAYETNFGACQDCLAANEVIAKNSSVYTYFTQFYANSISFCSAEGLSSEVTNVTIFSSPAETVTITVATTPGESFSILQPSSSDASTTPSSSTTTSSSCPPYPSFSFSSISSGNASLSIASVTAVQSLSTSPTSTYSFGFWLDYTYVLCPTRTVNTIFTYPASCLPPEYLWGCPPGYLCTPPQVDCDLEVGPPSNSYVCAPSDCKPPPAIHTPAAIALQEISPYPLPTGYFNLDPVLFGLDWGFFTANVSITSFASSPTITTIFTTPSQAPTPTPTPTPTPPPTTPKSNKWIAGPVVGSIAIVLVVVLAVLFLIRRHRRNKSGGAGVSYDKAQLDGTEVKPKEIAGNEIGELGDSAPRVEPSELDAGYMGEELGHELRS